jgi:hypothetical protein
MCLLHEVVPSFVYPLNTTYYALAVGAIPEFETG